MTFSLRNENAIYKKTTPGNLKWNLNLDTGNNIDLKFCTSSQTHEKKVYFCCSVLLLLIVVFVHFEGLFFAMTYATLFPPSLLCCSFISIVKSPH